MRSRLGVSILLVAAAVCLALAAPVQAQVGPTKVIGGPGGGDMGIRPESNQCRDNEFLTGVVTVAGKDLNAISAVCQPFDADGRWLGPNRGLHTYGDPNIPYRGYGTGSARCPVDTAAEQITVQIGANVVHQVALWCRHVNAHDLQPTNYSGGRSGGQHPEETVGCGGGALAIGIVGRYGSMIDAVGLLCRVIATPPPKVDAPAPPPKKTTPPPPPKPKPDKPPLKVDNGAGDDDDGGNGDGGDAGGVTAATDTTIYDQPEGNDVDYLSAGDPVTIVSCNENNWCRISRPRKGWVWGEDLNR